MLIVYKVHQQVYRSSEKINLQKTLFSYLTEKVNSVEKEVVTLEGYGTRGQGGGLGGGMVDPQNPDTRTMRDQQAVTRNLALAREHAIHLPAWRKYHPQNQHHKYNPYNICRTAWQANNHDGYYHDMIHILREVAGGNLTDWWQQGQTRHTTVQLFTDALTILGVHDIPKRGRKRLSADEVTGIRAELDSGIPVAQIAAKHGVAANSVYGIRRGITHKAA